MKKYLLGAVCVLALSISSNTFAGEHRSENTPPPSFEQQIEKQRDSMQKELADKLNLTDEQRERAKKIYDEGREQMRPLMEEGRVLHEKMEKVRKENLAEFEKILTDEQKKEFEDMKHGFRKKFHHIKPHRPDFGKKAENEK